MTRRRISVAVVAGLFLAGCSSSTGPQGPTGPTGPTGAAGLEGAQGPTGPMGLEGPQGPAGARGITWAGTWVPTTTYLPGDGVTHLGQSWVARVQSIANPPPSSDWQLLAAQGAQGVPGLVGPTGPTGPTGLPGPQGIQGIQGNQGSMGPTGPAGPSDAFYAYSIQSGLLRSRPETTTVVSLSLQPGTYVVTAMSTFQVFMNGSDFVVCYILVGEIEERAMSSSFIAMPLTVTATMTVPVTLVDPAIVSMRCARAETTALIIYNAYVPGLMTAIRVGSLTNAAPN